MHIHSVFTNKTEPTSIHISRNKSSCKLIVYFTIHLNWIETFPSEIQSNELSAYEYSFVRFHKNSSSVIYHIDHFAKGTELCYFPLNVNISANEVHKKDWGLIFDLSVSCAFIFFFSPLGHFRNSFLCHTHLFEPLVRMCVNFSPGILMPIPHEC